ncbi:acyl transferase/acyl hydrolase/lysophospholipase [Sporodiniella umbellata]|nr:acyl transferase/acyl hydrolase/lysophospholipase [Sporodiniella umbellata]
MSQDSVIVMSRSKIALVTLITVSVLGTFYYHTRQPAKPTTTTTTTATKKDADATKNSIYETFVESLPISIESEEDFLSKLLKATTDIIPTSLEEITERLNSIYPAFERQLEAFRNMYSSFWDSLFLEDFTQIVKESLEEDKDIELHPEIELDAHVREGQDIAEKEKEFIRTRKERIREAFAFFIGVDQHEVEVEDIPTIGIASSGGGYRAMIACSGYLEGFSDTGLLDCVSYMAGVSGSTWAMSQFYSPLADASVSTLKDHLTSRIHTHIANLSNFLAVLNASRHNAKILLHGVVQRYYQQNGSISLVDIFGMLLGGTLLTKKVLVDIKKEAVEEEEYSESISIAENTELSASGTIQEGKEESRPEVLHKSEIKLSKQKKYFEDGTLPMPIYCAVRHEINRPGITKTDTLSSKEANQEDPDEQEDQEEPRKKEKCNDENKETTEALDNDEKDYSKEKKEAKVGKEETKNSHEDSGKAEQIEKEEKTKEQKEEETEEQKEEETEEQKEKAEKIEKVRDEAPKDLYQWYEFTPYEMGSEEINAWIPIWSFGRKFEKGENTEKLPEQSIGVLMGMFGSAFVASLAHFYQEIRLLLPDAAVLKADQMIANYKSSVSTIHPISPASFPNPFYQMPTQVQTKDDDHEEILRSESLVSSQQIELMDAGMDNNIPFYPLLRKGRDVDIIISVDSSADIQDAPHFDRAEGYVKRRGIKGWPLGAGWPKKKDTDPTEMNLDKESMPKYGLHTCTVFSSESTETTPEDKDSIKTTYPENTNPITLIYLPLIVNENYDPEFDPQTAEFCSTWNFVYTKEQANKLHGLSVMNPLKTCG